jgi:F-type H+-transporting ATPase subunit delta
MQGGVSVRYAKALISIGTEDKSTARLQRELTAFAELYKGSDDLRNVLRNPSIVLDERKSLIRALAKRLGSSATMINFMQLLLDKDRIQSLPLIERAFESLADKQAGRIRAHVTTAKKLSPAQEARMKAVLGKLTGKTVVVETAVDEGVVGGVVTRICGKVYVGSISTQLSILHGQIAGK